MKTIDQYFIDWESHVFGYGYGTGEEHVIGALKHFFDTFQDERSYYYKDIEAAITAPVAWLLINALCHADVIEYGTSPRGAWLTENGKALFKYIKGKTLEELMAVLDCDEGHTHCFPDYCNCADKSCIEGNPFWSKPL